MKALFILSLVLLTSTVFAQSAKIVFPLENLNMRNYRKLDVTYEVKQSLRSTDKFVVFKSNNGAWTRVHEVAPRFRDVSTTRRVQNITPGFYYCEDTYAIRLMRGTRTLAGPVHFKAGAGACSGVRSEFINLEKNQVDLFQFKAANQANRDTCGSFAGVAALEAAYKRLQNRSVRLSQHYMHHINKSAWLTDKTLYMYENQSSYWGGNDTLTALKVMKYYPLPPLVNAPYKNQDELTEILTNLGLPQLRWSSDPRRNSTTQDQIDTFEYSLSNIPQSARSRASYSVQDYKYHVGAAARDTNRIENYLKAGQEVMISVRLDWRDHPRKAKTKLYDSTVSGGAHLMLIVGFDKTGTTPFFLVKNSWGEGIIRMDYDLVRNKASEIGVITKVRNISEHNPSHWIGMWKMQHDRWRGKLVIRRNYEANLDSIRGYNRIGEYVAQNGRRHCVWGGTASGSKVLRMYIDFDNEISVKWRGVQFGDDIVTAMARDVCPKQHRGQYFQITLPRRYSTRGTGTTWWNSRPFPVTIQK